MAINFAAMTAEIFETLQRDTTVSKMEGYARNVSMYLNYGNGFNKDSGAVMSHPLRIRHMIKEIEVEDGMDLPEDYLQLWNIGSENVDQYSYVPWSLFLNDKKNYEKYNIYPHGPTITSDGEKIFLLSEENEDRPIFRYYAEINELNFNNEPDYPHNWVDRKRPDLYREGIILQMAQQFDDEARRVEAVDQFILIVDLLNKHQSVADFHGGVRTTRRFYPPGG